MNPVAPYGGQDQSSQILVPASIAYKAIDGEEGPWVMVPYAWLYPPPVPPAVAPTRPKPGQILSRSILAPPVQKQPLKPKR
jgi:hypothetical protein